MTWMLNPYVFNAPQVAGAAMSADGQSGFEAVMVELTPTFASAHFTANGGGDAQLVGAQTTVAAASMAGAALAELRGSAVASAPVDAQGAAILQSEGTAVFTVFSMDGAATVSWVGEAIAPPLAVDAADFDGTDDMFTASLTGAADSKSGTLSFWLRLDGGDATQMSILDAENIGPVRFSAIRTSGNLIEIRGKTSADTTILVLTSSSSHVAGSAWIHVFASWDLSAGVGHLYVNDVDRKAGGATLTDATIDYTMTFWDVGATGIHGSSFLNGCLAELWFAPGVYIDLSVTSNRRKFISAGGKPANLGSDGSTPTGTAPIAYFHLDDGETATNFQVNRGTGGNFSITGTLDTASSSPSD